jgi:hypothetical protein
MGANKGVGTWKGDLRELGMLVPAFTGGDVSFTTLDTLSRAVGVARNPGVP